MREPLSLLASFLHTLVVFICQCVFASSVGSLFPRRVPVSVCHDCVATWGMGLSAVLIQAQFSKKKQKKRGGGRRLGLLLLIEL